MTIITDFNKAMKLKRCRRQLNLEFVPFSVPTLLGDIKSRLFPDVTHSVKAYFVTCGPLACVVHDDSRATIYTHQLLNHVNTPKDVMAWIVKHELLHLRIPPRTIDEKKVNHPPEFWDAERSIAPERRRARRWIWLNFTSCLKNRPRLGRIDVLPSWKRVWPGQRLSLEECQQIMGPIPDDENGWL